VQAAREAARRTQCRNNLKQVAVGIHHFESSHRYLPGHGGEQEPRGIDFGAQRKALAKGMKPTGNWIIQTIAFMEQQQLSQALLAVARGTATVQQRKLAVVYPVPTLYCPSRREPLAYPHVQPELNTFGPIGARTDYGINGGASTAAASNESNAAGFNFALEFDGVWAIGRRIALKHVVDGASNTYLVGEKSMDVLHYTTGKDVGDRAPIAGVNDNFGAANSYVRFAGRPPAEDMENNCHACHAFGSAHPAAWNISFTDGSVRSYAYSMDFKLHRALASIDGQELPETTD
jgi:hypothetical protein